jgi:hypothetical protein
LSYSTVRLALGGGARAAGVAAVLRASGTDLDADRPGRVALAVLDGAYGDLVQRAVPALALDRTVRVAARAVPIEAELQQPCDELLNRLPRAAVPIGVDHDPGRVPATANVQEPYDQ